LSFSRQLKVIADADAALAQLEVAQIDRTNAAMGKSLANLLRQLKTKLSAEQPGVNLIARDRAILIANDLRDALNIFSPDSPATQALLQDFEQLVVGSDEIGQRLADDQIQLYEPTIASTANLSLDVVAAVARDGYDRLLGRGTEFASNASVAIQQGILQGWGTAKIARAVKSVGAVTAKKAEQIVRTEVSRAANSAVRERYAVHGVEQVIWIATQDERVCPKCAARAGGIYQATAVTLPLHPSDRCYLSPYKKEWDDLGLIDHEWLKNHHADAISKAGRADYSASAWEQSVPRKLILK
jgi:SPP1 gp7 family putative phage head morphogenesis protein